MKVLMINKFLYPNGGSETYTFKLGKYLESKGHKAQYFGMEHEGRCVGNAINIYTQNMDFHGGSKLDKLIYPVKTVYSLEAKKKIRLVLDAFCPNVCHLNNFNYQLTPSIILGIKKWSKETGNKCKIIYTAHDGQLVCPNHLMRNPISHKNCEKCLSGNFINCVKDKCIHGSMAKSIVGTIEASFWKWRRVYQYIDAIICCSAFMKKKLDSNPLFVKKTVVIHNFVESKKYEYKDKKDYIFYFGRFSEEKGIDVLLEACRQLPDIPFVFAGAGPLENTVSHIDNVKNVGFQTGSNLERLIQEARFCVCPSSCYENCPFSVMESQMQGTPVLGADIGGIPELIKPGVSGELFESGNVEDLKKKIRKMWEDKELLRKYGENCKIANFDTVDEYYHKLMKIYKGRERKRKR